MKNTFKIFLISFSILMLCAGGALAASGTLDNSNTTLALVTETTPGYPDLTNINISPNVTLGYTTFEDEFAINGNNANGSVEYGAHSASADIYFIDASDSAYEFAAITMQEGDAPNTVFADYAELGGSE